MNCIVKGCPEKAEWLDLCQAHWEAYCSETWWQSEGGLLLGQIDDAAALQAIDTEAQET